MTQRDKWKQRPCVMAYRAWADRVRAAAGQMPPAETVLSLSWTASFIPPINWPKDRRHGALGTPHRQKPDRDNIDKAVLDILYPKGDQAIAAGTIEKQWGYVEQLEIRITVSL
jgi:Holliday junction resolvase RusA-like endonuclease